MSQPSVHLGPDASPGKETVIWQVSDPHLGESTRRTTDGRAWTTLAHRIRRDRPAAVLITGDLVAEDPDDELAQAHARDLVGALETRVWTLPGNHDVGDQTPRRPGLPPEWRGTPVTSTRCARWVDRWGPDRWCLLLPGWALIGLNSQIMGTGLPEEADQWSWLEQRADTLTGRHVAVFTHQALDATVLGLPAESWAAVPPPAARRLRRCLAALDLRLSAHGHVHCHHVTRRAEVLHVSSPSISAPIPVRPDMHLPDGDRRLGWIEYRFRPGAVESSMASAVDTTHPTSRPTSRS